VSGGVSNGWRGGASGGRDGVFRCGVSPGALFSSDKLLMRQYEARGLRSLALASRAFGTEASVDVAMSSAPARSKISRARFVSSEFSECTDTRTLPPWIFPS
jgi:hypothetical protein